MSSNIWYWGIFADAAIQNQVFPGMINCGDKGSVRVAHCALGSLSLTVLIGLLILLLLGACTGRSTSDATPDHTHAPPGSAGEILERKLEKVLPAQTPTGHQGSEGLTLGSNSGRETVYAGGLCDPSAPVREYDVLAISVEITLNRFLDYDPVGRMYVLKEELKRVRMEEAQNRAARLDQGEPAASLGLQGDGIQPLILRVNQGECLRVKLGNALNNTEPASFHLHGSGLHLTETGAPAIATNAAAKILPGADLTYEWMVELDEPEGTHYFHSHGDSRLQTNHGLFGALVVEPLETRTETPILHKPSFS